MGGKGVREPVCAGVCWVEGVRGQVACVGGVPAGKWLGGGVVSYGFKVCRRREWSERTNYSFVPSSLGERCFGFDAVIVIAFRLWSEGKIGMFVCSSLCHVVYRYYYANGKPPPAEKNV